MTKFIRRMLPLLTIGILLMTVPSWGEAPVATIKENVKAALINNDYYGEYTVTSFRFGRRQEVTYRIWAKDNYLVKQVQSPSWQRGELDIKSDKFNYYYIPSQNSGLKQERNLSRAEVRLEQWRNSLDRIDRVEESANLNGRTALVLSGESKGLRFKLWVARDTFLPLAVEYYRNNLLLRSMRFSLLNEFKQSFNPLGMLGENVRWFNDRRQFWQAVSIPRVQAAVNFKILQPTYLPEGYSFRWANIEELASATVAHLVYEGPNRQRISLFEREKLV